MSVVGEFPGFNSLHRRTIRGAVNPMDKSTVVSIYPKEIDEVKHTIQPGRFLIPAGSYENPAILVVGPSSWWRDIDEQQPILEIPVSSIQIADSIVRDYCNGVLACNMADSMPGLFYVPGQYSVKDIKERFKTELEKARDRQNKLWLELINMADALWTNSDHSPRAISEDMRIAARQLGQTNKDWLRNFVMAEMVRCFACGSLKNPEYPVCAACRAIDSNHPKAKDIKFAN
jgi:hypothetical protein